MAEQTPPTVSDDDVQQHIDVLDEEEADYLQWESDVVKGQYNVCHMFIQLVQQKTETIWTMPPCVLFTLH